MNSIKWSPKAVKQLLKVNKPERAGIKNAVGELAHMPDTRNVVALSNHKHQFRLRVGNYRVFFNFDGAIRIVLIEEVRKRDERTY
jgi:mRNA-degrading endonuclease RelE of RelBE toxin-antitoxin system